MLNPESIVDGWGRVGLLIRKRRRELSDDDDAAPGSAVAFVATAIGTLKSLDLVPRSDERGT
jgi:hypothetical protein